MKKGILVIAIVAGFLYYKFNTDENFTRSVVNKGLETTTVDAGLLNDIVDGIENKCDKGIRGLSENECIELIRTKRDVCIDKATEKFSGKIGNLDRAGEMGAFLGGCLFQKES
jgi:hypothetical protein